MEQTATSPEVKEGEDGFLLIEALAALAIFSLAVVALIEYSQISAQAQNRITVKAQAILEARNLIDSIGAEIDLKTGQQTIELPSRHTAKVAIAPYPLGPQRSVKVLAAQQIYSVSVIIEHKQFGAVASINAVKSRAFY